MLVHSTSYDSTMFGYSQLYESLSRTSANVWLGTLPAEVDAALNPKRNGNLPQWMATVASLPERDASAVDLVSGVRIGVAADLDEDSRARLRASLTFLCPWRKGPVHLFGIHIDTEWRSDWKWERLSPHIHPLTGRRILDVGCGNGYYALRMLGAGAELVMGLDPTLLFVMQFAALRRYLSGPNAFVLPLGIEHLPNNLKFFDTVFSMGVLYHRRAPQEHLTTLREALVPGGELVLETLVLDSQDDRVLIPEKRYAQMRNVWAIPSCARLQTWLTDAGFESVRIVDVTPTTVQEQRSTEWMTFHSLADFLDPTDCAKTIEGHPGPVRAIAIARSPV
ncbi:MAG: tRNA 5-methoxyuridine(34)/uridine 5-oxyacetic acid(34) synthase CmoB [Cyanobacteria bacterium P01_E01_bin.45]